MNFTISDIACIVPTLQYKCNDFISSITKKYCYKNIQLHHYYEWILFYLNKSWSIFFCSDKISRFSSILSNYYFHLVFNISNNLNSKNTSYYNKVSFLAVWRWFWYAYIEKFNIAFNILWFIYFHWHYFFLVFSHFQWVISCL